MWSKRAGAPFLLWWQVLFLLRHNEVEKASNKASPKKTGASGGPEQQTEEHDSDLYCKGNIGGG